MGAIRGACIFAAAVFIGTGLSTAECAEIRLSNFNKDRSNADAGILEVNARLDLKGQIEAGDLAKLKSVISDFEQTIERSNKDCKNSKCDKVLYFFDLGLISNGGHFSEGLKIAEFVAKNEITTRIEDGAACYSACGFIFLAGQKDESREGGSTPWRLLFPGSRLGLHSPYLDLKDDQSYSNEVVEKAYSLAVQHIAEIVRQSEQLHLDHNLLPLILGKTRKEIYLIDTAEKAVRFEISVIIKGILPRVIAPSMAKNYCQYLMAQQNKKFVSEMFRNDDPNVINRQSSFIKGAHLTIFQAKKTKVDTTAGKLDKMIFLLPMRRSFVEANPFEEICVADWYVWPDRKWEDPSKIIFSACVMTVESGADKIVLDKIFREGWKKYALLQKNPQTEEGCKGDPNLGGIQVGGNTSETLFFVPPDTPLESMPEALRVIQQP